MLKCLLDEIARIPWAVQPWSENYSIIQEAEIKFNPDCVIDLPCLTNFITEDLPFESASFTVGESLKIPVWVKHSINT